MKIADRDNDNHAETACLLSKIYAGRHIEAELKMDEAEHSEGKGY